MKKFFLSVGKFFAKGFSTGKWEIKFEGRF